MTDQATSIIAGTDSDQADVAAATRRRGRGVRDLPRHHSRAARRLPRGRRRRDRGRQGRRSSSRPRAPRATCPRRASPARSAARPASCGCSPASCAAATTSASASTRRCRTARRCPAPTSASGWCRSDRSPSSAPATSRSPSPPPAATPPPRSPRAARWSSRATPPTRAPATSSPAPSPAPSRSPACPPACSPSSSVRHRARPGARHGPADQGRRLHRLPRRRARARRGRGRARRVPIPVYAEMSSINPVVVLPGALAQDDVDALAAAYVGSLTLGSGQFCTNPGLLFLPAGEDGDAFLARRRRRRSRAPPARPMLTPGIAEAYAQRHRTALAHATAYASWARAPPGGEHAPRPRSSESAGPRGAACTDEVFGASGVVVRYDSVDDLLAQARGPRGPAHRDRPRHRRRPRGRAARCCPSSSSRPAASSSTAGPPASRSATRWSTAVRSRRRPTPART